MHRQMHFWMNTALGLLPCWQSWLLWSRASGTRMMWRRRSASWSLCLAAMRLCPSSRLLCHLLISGRRHAQRLRGTQMLFGLLWTSLPSSFLSLLDGKGNGDCLDSMPAHRLLAIASRSSPAWLNQLTLVLGTQVETCHLDGTSLARTSDALDGAPQFPNKRKCAALLPDLALSKDRAQTREEARLQRARRSYQEGMLPDQTQRTGRDISLAHYQHAANCLCSSAFPGDVSVAADMSRVGGKEVLFTGIMDARSKQTFWAPPRPPYYEWLCACVIV